MDAIVFQAANKNDVAFPHGRSLKLPLIVSDWLQQSKIVSNLFLSSGVSVSLFEMVSNCLQRKQSLIVSFQLSLTISDCLQLPKSVSD